jgi:hypothetical protein
MAGPLPRTRTVFFHQDPEWTFVLTRASLHHSLHERTFFYCLRSTRRQYPIKCTDFCPPRWTFLVRADLLSVIGGPLSLARGPFSFIRTRVDFSVHSRFACGPFSPRADLFLLLAKHASTVSYQTYGPLPDARGPLICYARTSVPCTRTFFIHHDPEWTFLLTRASFHHSLRERTFFYCLRGTRGQYCIKRTDICLPQADLFRSRGPFCCLVRTSVPRTRTVLIY